MKANVFLITNDRELRALCARMRFGASKELLTSNPVYAKDLAELEARFAKDYGPNAEKILADPRGGLMLFAKETPRPGASMEDVVKAGHLISCVTSIDTFEPEKCWHLSMCRIAGPPPPVRAPDDVAHRICAAFFQGEYKEGPPEGALKDVRHFRAPWRPN